MGAISRQAKQLYSFVLENGYEQPDHFPALEDNWPSIAAVLPELIGDDERLLELCSALEFFLEYSGRWDEQLALNLRVEELAVAAKDWKNAGWGAYNVGWTRWEEQNMALPISCEGRGSSREGI